MKITTTLLLCLGLLATTLACKKETQDKLNAAKQSISNASTIVSAAEDAQSESKKLKALTPLTNEELKAWLPEQIGTLRRSAYKVGKTGYLNVASVEGTFKDEDSQFKIEIIDGAGEMGSTLAMGMGMTTKMDMEEEDENKHRQTVIKNGFKAQQTYHKMRGDTDLQFMYDNRFIVMVSTKNIAVDETWKLVDELNLDDLAD